MASFGWLWGANDAEENQDVEHESGAERLGNSICLALCCSPFLLIFMTILLGWNERRAVCDSNAIIAGMDKVQEVGCDTAEQNGELVMFSCPLLETGLSDLAMTGDDFDAVFAGMKYAGIKVEAEMLQCVETERSESKKDNVGGGKTTIKTYTYTTQWKSTAVDSANFKKKNSQEYLQNCDVENPSWPSSAPETGSVYQNSVLAGAYTLPNALVKSISLTIPVSGTTPSSYTMATDKTYSTQKYIRGGRNIGSYRVKFYVNDWAKPLITALGKNQDGTIQSWTAPDSWLCSGFVLHDLRDGTKNKDTLFTELKNEASGLTWIIRFVGFGFMWMAFCLLAGPLEVAADCVPCIGPYLGDAIQAIACVAACPPGCACAILVIGVVWIAMRPLYGLGCMVVFCGIMGAMAAFKFNSQSQKQGMSQQGEGGIQVENNSAQVYGAGDCSGAPVPPDVARNIVQALIAEYLENREGAVGTVLDDLPPDQQEVLAPFEDQIRDAPDRHAAIQDIRVQWRM